MSWRHGICKTGYNAERIRCWWPSYWEDSQSILPWWRGKHIQQSSGDTEVCRDVHCCLGWRSWRGLQQWSPPCNWCICVQLLVSQDHVWSSTQPCSAIEFKSAIWRSIYWLSTDDVHCSGIWISLGCHQSMTQKVTVDRPWLVGTMACSTQLHLNQILTITGRHT